MVVLQWPQCPDGMIAEAVYLTPGASPSMAVAAGQDCGLAMMMTRVDDHPQGTAASHHAPGALARVGGNASGSCDMGGVLATCLAFLVTVLTALTALNPSWLRSVVRLNAPGPGVTVWAIAVRAPTLGQLCVLRT
ncbi:MAG: hypothetical protein ACREQ5_22575 [Candidatus Dormibacteria bacterium]